MAVNKKKPRVSSKTRSKTPIKTTTRTKRKPVTTRQRSYVPDYAPGTEIEYIEEPIDFEPMPVRQFGMDTHVDAGLQPGGVYVTVHKEKYKMGDARGINKMGGLASINCSQHYTQACQERMEKAREHNKRIENAEKQLNRLMRKKNPSDDEVKEIGRLQTYLMNTYKNVCGYCYADLGEKGLKANTVTPRYKSQGEFLRSHILSKDEIPDFKAGEVIRINSHGDLESGEKGVIQLINYLNMAYQNPQTYFTIWTKQGTVVEDTFRRIGFQKPKNMTFIWSNSWIDKPIYKAPGKYSDWFDGVFNVITYDYYLDNKNTMFGIRSIPVTGERIEVIKCERLCRKCRACYSGRRNFAIIEVLKSDARRHHDDLYSSRKTKTSAKKRTVKKPDTKPRKIDVQKYIPLPYIFKK